MKDNSRKFIITGVIAVSVLLTIGFTSYFLKFHSSLSTDAAQWSYFSAYISVFLNFSSLILLGIISYITYATTSSFNKLQATPLLDFSVKAQDNELHDSWYLVNCSNAAARNISIRFHIDTLTSAWVACYSLQGGTEIELPWLRFASSIEVTYNNALLNEYFLTTHKGLKVDSKSITEVEYNAIASDKRINHANLLLFLQTHRQIRKAARAEVFKDKNDYLYYYGLRMGLFKKEDETITSL